MRPPSQTRRPAPRTAPRRTTRRRGPARFPDDRELELGEYYSREADVDLADVLRIFWEHGESWQSTEAWLRERVAARERTEDPVSAALAAAVEHEVHAWWSWWQGDTTSAVDAATASVATLAGEALRAYRAVWEYFAASWAQTLAEARPEAATAKAAAQLRIRAEHTARKLRWFPRFEENPAQEPVGPDYDPRVQRTVEWIRRLNTRRRRFDETLAQMREDVASRQPTRFHLV